MKKEVQKTTAPKNLYLYIFNQIKQGLRPSQICKELGVTKQKLNYYLSSLKSKGFISKIGYGVWEISKEFNQKEVKKTTRVANYQLGQSCTSFKPNSVRAHAFQFKLKIKSNLKNWGKREEILSKRNIKFKDLSIGGVKRGQKLEFKGRKIWLTNNSIIIYEKSSYLGTTSKEAKQYAISDLISLIKSLERKLGADLRIRGEYHFKVSRQHYSLVKNSLARQYNREGKRLEVYNSKGLWFTIDNSFNLNEAETLHPVDSPEDCTKVQNFFNGVEQVPNYTPNFVMSAINLNAQNHANYAQNLKAHVESVKALGEGVKELVKTIKEMKK